MNTIIAKAGVDDDRMYEQAAEILKRGGLVAFPTETVYGDVYKRQLRRI